MYNKVIRPVLFSFPPESIHRAVAKLFPFLFSIPGVRKLVRRIYLVNDPRLERSLFGLKFPTPVGMAAGFDKEAALYNELADLGFGHVEIGTVTPEGQPGNPQPRLYRLTDDQALINRMGFNNDGVDAYVKKLKKRIPKVIIGGNIGKNTATPNSQAKEDYCICFEKLFHLVDYFVVNISCPNIKDLQKLQNKEDTVSILMALQELNKQKPHPKPVLLKISPDLNEQQLDEILEIIEETQLDGIVACNTSSRRDSLQTDEKLIESIGDGGLSGKPIREKSTRTIKYLHRKSGGKIPIIGVGGIMSPSDAMEKLDAGASLVQVYTGFIYNGPSLAKKINLRLIKNMYSLSNNFPFFT